MLVLRLELARGNLYQSGQTNELFLAFRRGREKPMSDERVALVVQVNQVVAFVHVRESTALVVGVAREIATDDGMLPLTPDLEEALSTHGYYEYKCQGEVTAFHIAPAYLVDTPR